MTVRSLSRRRQQVAVVHGGSGDAWKAMAEFLAALSLTPVDTADLLSHGPSKPSSGRIERLETLFAEAGAVIVLLTRDEVVYHGEPAQARRRPSGVTHAVRSRANVLFEAGLALGRARERTVFVQIGVDRPFGDLSEQRIIDFDGSPQRRTDLAKALQVLGCPVEFQGKAWLRAGAAHLHRAFLAIPVMANDDPTALQGVVRYERLDVPSSRTATTTGARKTLNWLRTSLQLSYDELGRMLDVSGETVRRWERGEVAIPLDKAAAIESARTALKRLLGLLTPEALPRAVRRPAELFGHKRALDWILEGRITEVADRYDLALTYQA